MYNWKQQVKYKCDSSALYLCVKRHPNQASCSEVNTIRAFLSIPDYQHWGIHSIWGLAFKQGATKLAKSSWFHYNKLLELRTSARKGKKPIRVPLRAQQVNQIWHADITIFKTLDGVKHYIYTVMDNYSRFIHSWRIEQKVSATVRMETIKDALKNAFGATQYDKIQLVTDGGPENDNGTIKEFLKLNHVNVNHTIALRDIVQSNSMMEAFYSITKYRCLYLKQILNADALNKVFSEWIEEYHTVKPHYALGIYTPIEVLNGEDLKTPSKVLMKTITKQGGVERRERNKIANCSKNCYS